MRAGLPVIASDVGGVKEAVTDGTTGFLVSPGNATELANRLAVLLANPVLRAQMGAAGRARFEREFTLEQMLQKTREVYKKSLVAQPLATVNAI